MMLGKLKFNWFQDNYRNVSVAPSVLWVVLAGTGVGSRGGGIVLPSVKALIITALLVLVA